MGISYGLAMLLVFLALLLFSALRILREYERGVVFQLGRFWKVKGPGLVLVIPAIQQMVRIDLRTIGTVMELNGEIVALGASAEVLGHPADAVAMLVGVLHDMGEVLPAGSFVMSGAITQAIPVKAGDCLTARFLDMGSITVRFGE